MNGLLALPQVTACFLFVATVTIPIINFPLRVSLHYMIWGESSVSDFQLLLETVLPFGVALITAVFVTDVGLVFSFLGAVTAAATSFVYPGLLFAKSKVC